MYARALGGRIGYLQGCTYAKLSDGSCSGTAGVATGYTAATKSGYTTPFAAYGTSSAANFKGQTYMSGFIKDGKCESGSSAGASGGGTAGASGGGTASPSTASRARSLMHSVVAAYCFTAAVCAAILVG